jgi:GNAT superfamily N-acetyltransferase
MAWLRLTRVRTDADRSGSPPGLKELDAPAFGAGLGALIDVYAAAMHVPAIQLPGRRAIMAAHSGYPAFRAIAVTVPPGTGAGTGSDAEADVGSGAEADTGPGAEADTGSGAGTDPGPGSRPAAGDGPIVAFAYGFRGATGQWWHDMVRTALTARSGPAIAAAWLADSFEIAELHVHPEHQRHGIGRQLLFRLTEACAERTAVLSTMDAESPARRLYRSLGFTDLITGYRFVATDVPYAVMGVTLPLRGDRP